MNCCCDNSVIRRYSFKRGVYSTVQSAVYVKYWPSTIKRCTCVNKRKQVGVKQKYNQDTYGLSQLEVGCQRSENQLQIEGLGPQWPTVEQPSQDEKEVLLWSEELWGQYVAVCSCLQLTSHTQPTSILSRIVWEVYFYKEVCSLKFVIMFDYVLHIFVYVQLYYGYTTYIFILFKTI